MTIRRIPVSLAFLVVLACDAEPSAPAPSPEDEIRVAHVEVPVDGTAPPSSPVAFAPKPDAVEVATRSPTMPGAKAAFAEIAAIVEREFVAGSPAEDELWTGAIDGMLDRLAPPGAPKANQLLSPEAASELFLGTKGELVGVGIKIERVADVVLIKGVLKGGPAAKADLRAGDRILGIDGTRVRDLQLADVVGRIRGKAGTAVELFVQRDTEEWTIALTRDAVAVPSALGTSLVDGVGYLRITSFAQVTATQLDERIADLRAAGTTRLVLDLRACPGGLLDATTGIAERFVPAGSTVVTIEGRDGKREALVTAEDRRGKPLPLVVLVGPDTASSAEILADALRAHAGATLVGDRTFGKKTVESVHTLRDGWALKLSVSRFITASGAEAGLVPDVRIPIPEAQDPPDLDALDPGEDGVLAAAMELLDRR